MEEVDSIILHFLRQLNINIDDETNYICELPVEIIVESVSKCLTSINKSLKLPTKLPPGISQRIEVAANIASICKDLGYKNDVGYQTFLYYNEAELRQVFMFLIERLPNENQHTTVISNCVSSSKKAIFYKEIGIKIGEELNSIWVPACCNSKSRNSVGDFTERTEHPKHLINQKEIIQKILKMKENQSHTSALLSKVTQNSDVELSKNDVSPIRNHNKNTDIIEKSLKELKEATIVLKQKLDSLESERNVMDVEYSQVRKSCEKSEADLRNVQNILSSIGISESDPSVDNILGKVQNNINSLHKKSEDITSRNLSLRVEIDKLRSSMASSESERNTCKKILTGLKETAKGMKDEYENKEKYRNDLKQTYEKLRGGNKRSIYTKRIMEIISNVDKQNMEITKILQDTRQLQKEINNLEGQLDRCFSIADETLFRDAKKDDQAKKAYKLLALLHSECNTIVSLVNDSGTLSRDVVDLEDNIKSEKAKRTEDTLTKIRDDLARMQEESA